MVWVNSQEERMSQDKFKPAHLLSAIIAVLALVASAGGLFTELYRDNAWVTQLLGNDLVTLVVAVPLLTAALILSRRGSLRAQLVWLGMLGYMLYNYAFYLFGAAFNPFFLIYAALVSLSIFALIFAVPHVDVKAISRTFKARTPVKWISGFMLFIAVALGGMWIGQWLAFVASGQVPAAILASGSTTSIVFALDLSLIVPGMALGAIWLWQRRPWGYVLGAVMILKGVTYTLALIAMAAFSAYVTGAWDALTVLWVILCIGCLLSCGFLLGNMDTEKRPVGEGSESKVGEQSRAAATGG
jgi:hypothetical protein